MFSGAVFKKIMRTSVGCRFNHSWLAQQSSLYSLSTETATLPVGGKYKKKAEETPIRMARSPALPQKSLAPLKVSLKFEWQGQSLLLIIFVFAIDFGAIHSLKGLKWNSN